MAFEITDLTKKRPKRHSDMAFEITDLTRKRPKRHSDMAFEITGLIKKHSKRTQAELLGQMERDFHAYNMDSPTLKTLCPTRWTV